MTHRKALEILLAGPKRLSALPAELFSDAEGMLIMVSDEVQINTCIYMYIKASNSNFIVSFP